MNELNLTFFEEDFLTDKTNFTDDFEIKAAMTDFAILTGGFVSSDYFIKEGTDLEHRTGYYWTRTDDGDDDVRVVDSYSTLNGI